jgi:divinyl chlorophyllide a 8-vinyl-reductase
MNSGLDRNEQRRTMMTAIPRRVCLLGATGTIGRATVRALTLRGHEVVCFVRPRPSGAAANVHPSVRIIDAWDRMTIVRDGFCGERFDAVYPAWPPAPANHTTPGPSITGHMSKCSRRRRMRAWTISSCSQQSALQKPKLAFQHAKLAFEAELTGSGPTWSIVRPTAYFKSLSGQVERVKRGRPFMVFGDGTLTACKPISDGEPAEYLVGCLDDGSRRNRVLPIGGPGEAITPRQQGEALSLYSAARRASAMCRWR